jgi:hypothetical protein
MSTLPERLRLLPAGLVMPDLAAVRDQDAAVETILPIGVAMRMGMRSGMSRVTKVVVRRSLSA